jgi:glycerol-3-phosphate O-acyltransferase/dihydroxyacetone phosphate acyltransferase
MKRRHTNSFNAIWQSFCGAVVKVFYRRFEISGAEHLPEEKGLILCANHVNALADSVIVQASTRKVIHPLARSGLFQNILLRPWLKLMGAVPIYRPGDKRADVKKNKDSFARCYEILAEHETLIIFPEGQSHSNSQLHLLKSGAARLTLGALDVNREAPVVIPVGLNFSRKGRFRGDVLVNFGKPIDMDFPEGISPRQTVRVVNKRITAGLKTVTINSDSWDNIDLVRRLERFFALRRGKIRRGNLSQRFSALQRLISAQQLLRKHELEKLQAVTHQLRAYERLCRHFGIKDYHLTLNYRPWFILVSSLRILFMLVVVFPLVVFALITAVFH